MNEQTKLIYALATAYCASLSCPIDHSKLIPTSDGYNFCFRGQEAAEAVLPVLESMLGSCSKHGKCVMLTHVVEDPDLDLSTIYVEDNDD